MSSVDARGRGASRKEPRGGYEGISVKQLTMVWWAYQAGLITKLALRAYFGCWELETRRRLSGGKYQPSFAELRKLVGGTNGAGQGSLRPVVNRLLALGLLRTCSKAGISFATSPEEIKHEDRSGLDAMLDEMQGTARKVPVPRRIIRRLAGGLSKARTAVVIAHLIRCLFYRKAEGINPVGCCKASWIARVFGITERSVYDARAYLILELGWLIPQDNTQRILNRDGLWVTVNLDWGPEESKAPEQAASAPELSTEEGRGEAPSENDSSGPRAENAGQFSGPSTDNKNPLTGSNNQKPACGGAAGVQVSNSGAEEKPTLRDVLPEDLRDTGRLLELHEQAIEQKLLTTSEADRLKFIAGAEHAKAVGSKPCRLFAWMAWKGRWEFITQADEDAARVRLKQHFQAPPLKPIQPTTRQERKSLSPDALLVQTITAALKRANHRGDGFPLLKREQPEWTRDRWDRALAELEANRVQRSEVPQGITAIGSLVGMLGGIH